MAWRGIQSGVCVNMHMSAQMEARVCESALNSVRLWVAMAHPLDTLTCPALHANMAPMRFCGNLFVYSPDILAVVSEL